MATLYMASNGVTIYPALPIEREDVLIVEDKRHKGGQLRRAYTATKKRLRYGLPDATEAERADWIAAHPLNVSFAHGDELGVARTMITISRSDTLVRTEPAVNGSLSTTGPAFYDLAVELEEV